MHKPTNDELPTITQMRWAINAYLKANRENLKSSEVYYGTTADIQAEIFQELLDWYEGNKESDQWAHAANTQ